MAEMKLVPASAFVMLAEQYERDSGQKMKGTDWYENALAVSPQAPAREGDGMDKYTQEAALWRHHDRRQAALTPREEAPAEGAGEISQLEMRAMQAANIQLPVADYQVLVRDLSRAACDGSEITADALRKRTSEPEAGEAVKMTVWYGSMPESNGKANWTAVLHRKDSTGLDLHSDGFCFARSEYPERVRYEADEMRWIIGERSERPDILAYDADLHSGYTHPSPATADKLRVALDGDLAERLARYLEPDAFENRRRSSRNQHAANLCKTRAKKTAKRVLRFKPIAQALATLSPKEEGGE